jgi:hypothetical protein
MPSMGDAEHHVECCPALHADKHHWWQLRRQVVVSDFQEHFNVVYPVQLGHDRHLRAHWNYRSVGHHGERHQQRSDSQRHSLRDLRK